MRVDIANVRGILCKQLPPKTADTTGNVVYTTACNGLLVGLKHMSGTVQSSVVGQSERQIEP
jgi:hypothetical protein